MDGDALLGLVGLGVAVGIAAHVFSATTKAARSVKNKSKDVFGF